MLDADLAELYAVETRALNQAVARNIDRFPDDFMVQLTELEARDLRSQSVTSNWGGRRYIPYAFTEHGILMLSNVLKSERAILVREGRLLGIQFEFLDRRSWPHARPAARTPAAG